MHYAAGGTGISSGLGQALGALTMGQGFGAMQTRASMRDTREKVAKSLGNVRRSFSSMRIYGAHTATHKGVSSHNRFMSGSRLFLVLFVGALAQGGAKQAHCVDTNKEYAADMAADTTTRLSWVFHNLPTKGGLT